jgi:hypothetical protein
MCVRWPAAATAGALSLLRGTFSGYFGARH